MTLTAVRVCCYLWFSLVVVVVTLIDRYYPVHYAVMRHSLAKLFGQEVLDMPLKYYIPITVRSDFRSIGDWGIVTQAFRLEYC